MEEGSSDNEVVFEDEVWEIEAEDGERPPEDGVKEPKITGLVGFIFIFVCRFAGGDGRHGI